MFSQWTLVASNFGIAVLHLKCLEIFKNGSLFFCQAVPKRAFYDRLEKIHRFTFFRSQGTHSEISFLYTFAVMNGILNE